MTKKNTQRRILGEESDSQEEEDSFASEGESVLGGESSEYDGEGDGEGEGEGEGDDWTDAEFSNSREDDVSEEEEEIGAEKSEDNDEIEAEKSEEEEEIEAEKSEVHD